MNNQEKYDRSRCFYVPMEQALFLLNWGRYSPEYIQVPALPQSLPPDSEVLSVHTSFNPMALAIVVYHPSFPLRDNSQIPPLDFFPDGGFTARRVALKA